MLTLLLQLVIALIIISAIIWLIGIIPGMDPTLVQIVRVLCIVIFVIYIIYILIGVMGGGGLPAVK
jgi:hypothetical protein